jgi:hypothetical protein
LFHVEQLRHLSQVLMGFAKNMDSPARLTFGQKLRGACGRLFHASKLFHVEQLRHLSQVLRGICEEFGIGCRGREGLRSAMA